jgi:hypothetical protein
MLYAVNSDGLKLTPSAEGLDAFCPCCGEPVIAKLGDIRVHHWAHKSNSDCDTFSEGETEWHKTWKSFSYIDNTEVVIEKDGKRHRADAVGRDGIVIEYQHSPISSKDVLARESFYGKMVWVLDGRLFRFTTPKDKTFLYPLDTHDRKSIGYLNWTHAKKAFLHSAAPIYIDIGNYKLMRVIANEESGLVLVSSWDQQQFVDDYVVTSGKLGSLYSFLEAYRDKGSQNKLEQIVYTMVLNNIDLTNDNLSSSDFWKLYRIIKEDETFKALMVLLGLNSDTRVENLRSRLLNNMRNHHFFKEYIKRKGVKEW